ncbi:MAG: hypothetical protein ACFE0S_00335 [Rhodospirillales bacterium]
MAIRTRIGEIKGNDALNVYPGHTFFEENTKKEGQKMSHDRFNTEIQKAVTTRPEATVRERAAGLARELQVGAETVLHWYYNRQRPPHHLARRAILDRLNTIAPFLLFAFVTIAFPVNARAQTANNLGEVFLELFKNGTLSSTAVLITGIAFLVGIGLVISGFIGMAKGGPGREPGSISTEGLAKIAAGSFMVSLVSMIGVGIATFGGPDASIAMAILHANGVQNIPGLANGGDNIISMIGNFAVTAAGPLAFVTMAVAVIIGLIFVAKGLSDASKVGSTENSGRVTYKSATTLIVVGVMLTNSPWIIGAVLESLGLGHFSLLGSAAEDAFNKLTNAARDSLLSYNADSAADVDFKNLSKAAASLIFLSLMPFGLIAFVKGMVMLVGAANDQGGGRATFGAAFTFIIAGACMVNGYDFSCAVVNTFSSVPPVWCEAR